MYKQVPLEPEPIRNPSCSACGLVPWVKWCRPCNGVYCGKCIETHTCPGTPNLVRRELLNSKSSRVAHLLLLDRGKTWGVIELSEAAGIAPSYAVGILQNLVQIGWVGSGDEGYTLTQPRMLLDSWANSREFARPHPSRGFVIVGDTTEAESRFRDVANRHRARYAFTLFSGARFRAPFVRYLAAHVYLEGSPDRIVKEMGARPVSEGGNLVVMQPDDEGVFLGLQECDGARVVSDPRLYVDLFHFKARGREQAEFLLEKVMPDLFTQESPSVQAALHEALEIRDKVKVDEGGLVEEHVADQGGTRPSVSGAVSAPLCGSGAGDVQLLPPVRECRPRNAGGGAQEDFSRSETPRSEGA